MKKLAILGVVAVVGFVGAALAYGALARSEAPSSSRDTVTCPLTGREIPRSQCPLCTKQGQ